MGMRFSNIGSLGWASRSRRLTGRGLAISSCSLLGGHGPTLKWKATLQTRDVMIYFAPFWLRFRLNLQPGILYPGLVVMAEQKSRVLALTYPSTWIACGLCEVSNGLARLWVQVWSAMLGLAAALIDSFTELESRWKELRCSDTRAVIE